MNLRPTEVSLLTEGVWNGLRMHAKACAAGSTRFASTGRAEKPKADGGWLLATGDNVRIHCALFFVT